MSQDYELLSQLASLSDVYLQSLVYQVIMTILLDQDSTLDQENGRRILVHNLTQRLVDPQGTRTQQRAILELFHKLLKHHRHLIRNQPKTSYKDHVAWIVIDELSPPRVWEEVFGYLIRATETQHATLTLLIDTQKAWCATQHIEIPVHNAGHCHGKIMESIHQLVDISQFRPSNLRKLFELLCLLLDHIHRAVLENSVELDEAFRQCTHITTSLSPITVRLMRTLRATDPHLETLTRATTFIHGSVNVDSAIDQDLVPLTSCPEAIRQLGRVHLAAALSILEILSKMAMCIERQWSSLVHIQSMAAKLLSFTQEWLGPRTMTIIVSAYGEDDAALCWILKTMGQIQQQLAHLLHTQQGTLVLIQPKAFNDLCLSLNWHAHPTEALFVFLESIGYDYQTLLDLLLTMDDQQSGGMLAAIMVVLRNFTEQEWEQKVLIKRWHDLSNDSPERQSMDGSSRDPLESTRARLFNIEFCLARLAGQIRRLQSRDMFPYNPKALLAVLDRTCAVLSTVISESILH